MKKTVLSLAAVATITGATTVSASAQDVTVNKGDTLWSIGQENGISVSQLKEINNLDSNIIYPSQRLSVDGQAETSNQQAQSSQSYTVKSGDTLWSIGQENGVSVASLKSWNNLSSSLIFPGQELALNGSTSTEGETVQKQQSQSNQAEATNNNNNAEQKQSSQEPEGKTYNMEATAYTANCDGCSGVTATGIDLNANPNKKVIAVDPDTIPLGSEVYVEGYGKAVAGDIGGDIQGNRIDVFMKNHSEAINFGRQTVEVTVLD
ncbi:LysM peptidoglycan-binding domain-containing protein [Pontibacillus salicampi]|uniref:LysM peptidoglycan-binding domain-containing protein n=1 Tax=Pontibacillus salicampi TaxID=1449801 RepID=A0ABV6LQE3_9BACI